jgi:hypothetical protein
MRNVSGARNGGSSFEFLVSRERKKVTIPWACVVRRGLNLFWGKWMWVTQRVSVNGDTSLGRDS